MLKKIGIVVLGLIVANVLIMCVQTLGHKLFPLSAEVMDLLETDPKAFMSQMSTGSILMVWLAYVVGSVISGFVIGKLGKEDFGSKASYWVGGLLTVFGIINLLSMPHPWWFAVGTTLTYVPACWFGAKAALKN